MNDIIVDYITQTPGDYEIPSMAYKGKKFRTVFFLDDFKLAQFVEVNDKLIRDWKKYDKFTSTNSDSYASMNLSLDARSYIAVYHDSESVTLEQAIDKIKNASF